MKKLADWLNHIETFNPSEIEFGLDRVFLLSKRLNIDLSGAKVIIVGGTNGKGSCVASLESLARQSDLRVGCYTSPHLLTFNERIKLNGLNVCDERLSEAFQSIETCRKDTPLTFFEFTTLAALMIFQAAQLDLIVLEVGLGGRLDAVNIIDPDVAILTTIAKDHESWLGSELEQIAFEKSGIYRNKSYNLIGDSASLNLVDKINQHKKVEVLNRNQYFTSIQSQLSAKLEELRLNPQRLLLQNVGLAFAAFNHLFPLKSEKIQIESIIKGIQLTGRFQTIGRSPDIIVDVAHNPQSACNLVRQITRQSKQGKCYAICGMMADKATVEYIQILDKVIDGWIFVDLPIQRAATGEQLLQQFSRLESTAFAESSVSVETALKSILSLSTKQDTIFVIGSFYTVAELLVANTPFAESLSVDEIDQDAINRDTL